jgi:hypothetical protein
MALVIMDRLPRKLNHHVKIRDDIHYHTRERKKEHRYSAETLSWYGGIIITLFPVDERRKKETQLFSN